MLALLSFENNIKSDGEGHVELVRLVVQVIEFNPLLIAVITPITTVLEELTVNEELVVVGT